MMNPMITVSVFYPKTATSRFDFAYYLDTHTPMLKRLLEPAGMQNLRLLRGKGSLDGGAAPYEVTAHFDLPSLEVLQNALSKHGAQIIGDMPNYTDVQPVIQINEAL
jgi:uncharacterized protein (TIGR02118 family)